MKTVRKLANELNIKNINKDNNLLSGISEESLYEQCKKQMILMEEIYDRGIVYQNDFRELCNKIVYLIC